MRFKNKIALFRHVWETRPHVSELSGKPLLPPGHWQHHWQYLHVLGGNYPHYKLESRNVLLGLPEEHQNQNQYEVFNQKTEELKREYYKEFYGKEFE